MNDIPASRPRPLRWPRVASIPLLYLLGLLWISALVVFGWPLTLALLSDSPPDGVVLHDSYFEAHDRTLPVLGGVCVAFAALHHVWQRWTGKTYSVTGARIGWLASFLGFNLALIPQYVMAATAMPRRYLEVKPHFGLLDSLSTIGAVLLIVGFVIAITTLARSYFSAPRGTAN